MTVSELIEELSKMPASLVVMTWDRSTEAQFSDIESVDKTEVKSVSSGERTEIVVLNSVNRWGSKDSTKG